ncbi:MAG: hypothetical protein H7326_10420 [Bdellovibrionaceae bacterium]|nr:hypothetical protein [Pseudobdellovibrionaceae bacterium]
MALLKLANNSPAEFVPAKILDDANLVQDHANAALAAATLGDPPLSVAAKNCFFWNCEPHDRE